MKDAQCGLFFALAVFVGNVRAVVINQQEREVNDTLKQVLIVLATMAVVYRVRDVRRLITNSF